MTKSTNIYDFVEEVEDYHQKYMAFSLRKNKISKQLVKQIRLKTIDNKFVVKILTFNQFMNEYKNAMKTNYPFLPINQIMDKMKQMWNRFKDPLNGKQYVRQSTNGLRPKSVKKRPKSSLKVNSTEKKSLKKVSFDLSANNSVNIWSERQNSSLKSHKYKVSKYMKPLDITAEDVVKDKTLTSNDSKSLPEMNSKMDSIEKVMKWKSLSKNGSNCGSDRVMRNRSLTSSHSSKRALFESPNDMTYESPKMILKPKNELIVSPNKKSEVSLNKRSIDSRVSSKRALFQSPKDKSIDSPKALSCLTPKTDLNSKKQSLVSMNNKSEVSLSEKSVDSRISSKKALFESQKVSRSETPIRVLKLKNQSMVSPNNTSEVSLNKRSIDTRISSKKAIIDSPKVSSIETPIRVMRSKNQSMVSPNKRSIDSRVLSKKALFESQKVSISETPIRALKSKNQSMVSPNNKSKHSMNTRSTDSRVSPKSGLESDSSQLLVSINEMTINSVKKNSRRAKASIPEDIYSAVTHRDESSDLLLDLFD